MNEPTVGETFAASSALPSIPTLFREAWQLVRTHARLFFGILALPAVVTLFSDFLSTGFFGDPRTGGGFLVEHVEMAWRIPLGVLLVLFLLFALLVSVFAAVAVLVAIRDRNEGISAREAYRRARTLFLPYLLVTILSSLIISGGFMLLVVPGLILAVWFAFAMFAVTMEGERGMQALFKSRAYVTGHWWSVALRLLVLFLVIGVFAAVIGSLIVAPFSSILSNTATAFLFSLVSSLLNLVLVPFGLAYAYHLYQGLRAINPSPVPSPKGKNILIAIAILPLIGLAFLIAFAPYLQTLG